MNSHVVLITSATTTISKFIVPLFFLILITAAYQAHAADREVSISLEELPEVSSYEVEVAKGSETKSDKFFKRFNFNKSEFKIPLKVGRYLLRTRSLDLRKIAGPWSDWEQIVIPPPKIDFITDNEKPLVASGQSLLALVPLKWQPIADIENYKIVVTASDGEKVLEKEITGTALNLDLPPGDYKILLSSLSDGVESDEKSELAIHISGAKLTPLEIQNLEVTNEGLQISWQGVNPNAHYSGQIERQDIGAENPNEWEPVLNFENIDSSILKLPSDSRPGHYRLKVSAAAKGWQSSQISMKKFTVKPKERSLSSIQDEIKPKFDFSQISN